MLYHALRVDCGHWGSKMECFVLPAQRDNRWRSSRGQESLCLWSGCSDRMFGELDQTSYWRKTLATNKSSPGEVPLMTMPHNWGNVTLQQTKHIWPALQKCNYTSSGCFPAMSSFLVDWLRAFCPQSVLYGKYATRIKWILLYRTHLTLKWTSMFFSGLKTCVGGYQKERSEDDRANRLWYTGRIPVEKSPPYYISKLDFFQGKTGENSETQEGSVHHTLRCILPHFLAASVQMLSAVIGPKGRSMVAAFLVLGRK